MTASAHGERPASDRYGAARDRRRSPARPGRRARQPDRRPGPAPGSAAPAAGPAGRRGPAGPAADGAHRRGGGGGLPRGGRRRASARWWRSAATARCTGRCRRSPAPPVPFGAVPAGTGNDFAADIGFPADPLAAVDAIAAALRAGRTHPVDLARMTGADGAVALVRGGARRRVRRDRQRAGQPDALAARPAPVRPGDPGGAGPAAPPPVHAAPRRRAARAGRGAGGGRQLRQLRRWDADLPGRRPDRRAARRGGRRPVRPADPGPGQAAHLRRAPTSATRW